MLILQTLSFKKTIIFVRLLIWLIRRRWNNVTIKLDNKWGWTRINFTCLYWIRWFLKWLRWRQLIKEKNFEKYFTQGKNYFRILN